MSTLATEARTFTTIAVVGNMDGIHMRPSMSIISEVKRYPDHRFFITRPGVPRRAEYALDKNDLSSAVLSLFQLAATYHTQLEITVEGIEAEKICLAMKSLIEDPETLQH